MIKGIGIDIESIKDFKKYCNNKNFIDKIFSKKE